VREVLVNDTRHRVQVRVHGRVQGVAFRWYAQQEARRRGVRGWVRNCPDGTVKVLAEADRATLEGFLIWLAEGPSHARVERLETHWSDAGGGFDDFLITG
jgi:acylphosphatase